MMPTPGPIERIEHKLDRMSSDIASVREALAGMAERFTPRADHEATARSVAVLQSDMRRIWAGLGAIGASVLGLAATVLGQLFGG